MRFCSKCGNKLTDDQLYCPKCGNKEPFVKNSKKSSWKDFEPQSQATNVNYDFQSKNVAAARAANPQLMKNKSLRNLGRVTRIVSLVFGIFVFAIAIVMTVTSIGERAKDKTTGNILNIIALALAGVQMVLSIVLTSVSYATKNWNPLIKNQFISIATMSVIAVGLTIGQYFSFKLNGIALMGTFTGIMGIMAFAMTAKVCPLKKVAK